MGILADRLNTMSVRVISPDRTVRLYLTGGGQLHIEFAAGSLDQHSEGSLSKQLSHVCTEALRRQKQEMTQTLLRTIAETDVDEDDTFARSSAAEPSPARESFDEAATRLIAVGRSPRSSVTARRSPGDFLEVKLRKGTLQRWSGAEVAVEIYAALGAVSADYQRRLQELQREPGESTDSDRAGR